MVSCLSWWLAARKGDSETNHKNRHKIDNKSPRAQYCLHLMELDFPGDIPNLYISICLQRRRNTGSVELHEVSGQSDSVCHLAGTKEASEEGSRHFPHERISLLSHRRLRSSQSWMYKDLFPSSCSCWKKSVLYHLEYSADYLASKELSSHRHKNRESFMGCVSFPLGAHQPWLLPFGPHNQPPHSWR